MRRRARGIDDDNGGVGRGIWPLGIDGDSGVVGKGRRRDDATEGLEKTIEEAAVQWRAQGIGDDNRVVSGVIQDQLINNEMKASEEEEEETPRPGQEEKKAFIP